MAKRSGSGVSVHDKGGGGKLRTLPGDAGQGDKSLSWNGKQSEKQGGRNDAEGMSDMGGRTA